MRVFLTGATGHIGEAILDTLVRGGHEVTALVRSAAAAEKLAHRGVRPVTGNLREPDSYVSAAIGHDAYVHAAFDDGPQGPAVEEQTVTTLLQAATGAPSTFVYTSCASVLGPAHEPVAEDAVPHPPDHLAWLPAIERRVLTGARGVRTMVVRPGIVYGGGRGIISDMMTDAENGLIRVVGNGENHWPVVYDRDLAELSVRLLSSADAAGVFHVTDESYQTVREIVEAIAAHVAARPEVRYMPLPEARKKRGAVADVLALDQLVRSTRARELGWAPSLGTLTHSIPRLYEEWRSARREAEAEREALG